MWRAITQAWFWSHEEAILRPLSSQARREVRTASIRYGARGGVHATGKTYLHLKHKGDRRGIAFQLIMLRGLQRDFAAYEDGHAMTICGTSCPEKLEGYRTSAGAILRTSTGFEI